MGEVIAVDLWDVVRTSRFLGKSKVWIYRAVRKGMLPHLRVGNALRFSPVALERWVQQNSSPAIG